MGTMDGLIMADGCRLHLRRWPAAAVPLGTVQIVHGLGEHIGRYEAVAATLNAAGWNVVGHDHRGHGRSDGARGSVPQGPGLLGDLAEVIGANIVDAAAFNGSYEFIPGEDDVGDIEEERTNANESGGAGIPRYVGQFHHGGEKHHGNDGTVDNDWDAHPSLSSGRQTVQNAADDASTTQADHDGEDDPEEIHRGDGNIKSNNVGDMREQESDQPAEEKSIERDHQKDIPCE